MQPFKYKAPVNTGQLRHRITFLNPPSEGTNENGFPSTEWTEVTTIWAGLKTITGKGKSRVFYEAAAQQMQDNLEFYFRYRSDLHKRMRLIYNDIEYEIVALEDENGLKKMMTCIVREVI